MARDSKNVQPPLPAQGTNVQQWSPPDPAALEAAGVEMVQLAQQLQQDLRTRVTAAHPNGPGVQMTATQLAELGAIYGARNSQRGAVVGLLHKIQEAAIKTVVEMAPELMSSMDEVDKAKFNRAIQEVMALPTIAVPTQLQSGLSRFLGTQVQTVDYIPREAVLRLLAIAAERPLTSA